MKKEMIVAEKGSGDFIKFEIGDATVYSRVYKQLITEAKAITPYGMDIAAMLQDGSDVDFNADRPTKETIVEADAEMKAIMEEQAKTEYQAMAKEWVARKSYYKQNQSVMCGLIMKRCHTELGDRLESRAGYQDWSMRKPLLFLRMIKEECVAFKENENPCYSQHKIFKDVYNIAQGTEETVAEYTKRVKVHWELLQLSTSIFYTKINPKIHSDYLSKTDIERVVLNVRTDEKFIAYVMMVGADRGRFGRVIARLEESYDVGTDEYPRTIEEAKNYLDRTAEKKSHGDDGDVKSVGAVPQCQTQIKDDEVELSFATIRMCYVCGKKGHLAPKCSLRRKIPEEDWYIARVKKQQAPKTENIYAQAKTTSNRTRPGPHECVFQECHCSCLPDALCHHTHHNTHRQTAGVCWNIYSSCMTIHESPLKYLSSLGYELILRWIFLPHTVASTDAFIILVINLEPTSIGFTINHRGSTPKLKSKPAN
jgi:hypothetical protein